MTALVLDPHGDDAALFAAYTCLGEHARIVVTHPTVPAEEISRAYFMLGCPMAIASSLDSLKRNLAIGIELDVVYAPKFAPDGHDEHNEVWNFAVDFYGSVKVQAYLTYAPRGQRSREGTEVIPEPWMIAAKLRALSCYESQIENPATRPWFYSLLDMREWVS